MAHAMAKHFGIRQTVRKIVLIVVILNSFLTNVLLGLIASLGLAILKLILK